MARVAFLLAGQGAQKPGMGRSLYEHSPAARALFDTLEAIRPGTLEMCFSGSAQELSQTANTQPCVFAVDMACAAAAQEAGLVPAFLAGFSLGELAGVALSGMLPVEDAFRLVIRRAELMDECAKAHPGAMLAVLKLEAARVEALAREFSQVYPVNYNSPGQTVVACASEEADAFASRVQAEGGRAMRLKVSGGFHSPFMQNAQAGLAEALKSAPLAAPRIPLYANQTALPYSLETARECLAGQVAHPVRWQQTVEKMIEAGVDTFVEVGAGKTLCGLIKKTSRAVKVYNVEDAETLSAAVQAIRAEGENA